MTWVDWLIAAYLFIGCAIADRIMCDLARRRPDAARQRPVRFVLRSTSVAVAWLPIAVLVAIEDWRQ
ncbi:hypothetical protein ACFQ15_05650 [Sphingomonas hankookensis]|uniref:hypothetical protein n=1 Tax=Sphingomonas hankookensis TaxID=563996 RepID=UPI001F5A3378|nr:hypothetical protein [Sphingomonas hankookensis]